jgi:hypothetical protein
MAVAVSSSLKDIEWRLQDEVQAFPDGFLDCAALAVITPPAKAGGFELRLKAGSAGPLAG